MGYRQLTIRSAVNELGRETFAHTLEGDVDRTAQWNDVFQSIGRIKHKADSLGVEFLLSTYPWAHQLGESGWVPGRYSFMKKGEHTSDLTQRTIRERSTALGIELFEALPVFKKHQGAEPLYFDYDPHFTPAGHRVMAEGLARHIAEHQLPRWCASR
jgi:hypothetical protein